jgi:hypothetical protein
VAALLGVPGNQLKPAKMWHSEVVAMEPCLPPAFEAIAADFSALDFAM